MNLKGHLAYGLAIVVALLALVYFERRAGAAEERAKVTADSLAAVTHALTVRADSALAHQRQDSISEVAHRAQLRIQAQAVVAATLRADSLAAVVRASVPVIAQAAFDSLRATQARIEASLTAQRDSAIAMFTHAAASRDSLAGLVRQLQVQQQGLSTALAQASRKPIWEAPGIKIIEGALAVYGAARLLGR